MEDKSTKGGPSIQEVWAGKAATKGSPPGSERWGQLSALGLEEQEEGGASSLVAAGRDQQSFCQQTPPGNGGKCFPPLHSQLWLGLLMPKLNANPEVKEPGRAL